jgi:hypothetical protein
MWADEDDPQTRFMREITELEREIIHFRNLLRDALADLRRKRIEFTNNELNRLGTLAASAQALARVIYEIRSQSRAAPLDTDFHNGPEILEVCA